MSGIVAEHSVIVPIFLPLFGAILAFLMGRRSWPWLIGLIVLGNSVALWALTRQVLEQGPLRYAIGGWGAPLGIDWYADGLTLLMLWLTLAVGGLVSVYALSYFVHAQEQAERFWPLWLLLWMALNALFLAADVFNLYVTLELLTLAAIPLVALTGDDTALRASMRYLLFALLGSFCYMLGVALLYGGFGTLDLLQLGQLTTPGPLTWAALSLLTLGLLVKAAIFPFHIWLPPAHSSAPSPVSALLSALVVKGALYLLLRLWFQGFPQVITPAAGQLLGWLGGIAIIYGSLQALRQERLKLLVAYSTVAQLGYLLLLYPLAGTLAWSGAILQLVAHGIAKTALFLAAGNVLHAVGHDNIKRLGGLGTHIPLTLFAFGLAGISIMGMPPSGGFLAKWLLLRAAMDNGQWWWIAILLIGGLLAAGYVFRVLAYTLLNPPDSGVADNNGAPLSRTQEWIPLLLGVCAVILGFAGVPFLAILDIGSPFGAYRP